jgi:hypothetical protein
MANRNTLAIHKLDEFKTFLEMAGVEHRPTEAAYQVLQVRLPGDPRWHAIYKKLEAKQHLSVTDPLLPLLRAFVNKTDPFASTTGEQRAAKKALAHHKVYGCDLDTTPPWE